MRDNTSLRGPQRYRTHIVIAGIALLLVMANHSDTQQGIDRDEDVISPSETDLLSVPRVDRSTFFQQNGGQVDPSIEYYIAGMGVQATFSRSSFSYHVMSEDHLSGETIMVTFREANDVIPEGREPTGHAANYLLNDDPADWVLGAGSYRSIVYRDLYDGVDLAFICQGTTLKYQFEVSPGADPSSIRLVYDGAREVTLDDETGELVLQLNERALREDRPVAFQNRSPSRVAVSSRYSLISSTEVTFSLGYFDRRLPLVIDPGLEMSTYLGGGYQEDPWDMDRDGSGNIYVTGRTKSLNFTTTAGAYSTSNSGLWDAFLYKFDPTGTRLLYSTYLGGSRDDEAQAVEVDGNGSAWVCGYTKSTDFPMSSSPFENTSNGATDAFVARIGPQGDKLMYSTYIGGSNSERALDLSMNGTDAVRCVGLTTSTDYPISSNALYSQYNGGTDGFVTELNTSTNTLVYSTYIGGSAYDYIQACDVDANGTLYCTGMTESLDFPVTSGSFIDQKQNTDPDGFALKLSPDGQSLVYSTFVGGWGDDSAMDIQVDRDGNVYVVGHTTGGIQVTQGAYDKVKDGYNDGYVLKLNATGSGAIYFTYIGGNDSEYVYGLIVDKQGRAVITGLTASRDYPTTDDAYDSTPNGPNPADAFITRFSKDGSSLDYSTLFGGTSGESGYALELDGNGRIILAGSTGSNDLPTVIGTYSSANNGGWDTFLAIFDIDGPEFGKDRSAQVATTGDDLILNITVRDNVAVSNVTVEYWTGNATPHLNASMDRTSGTSSNGTWEATLTALNNSTARFHYIFLATDTAENNNTTARVDIWVEDNDAPGVTDVSPANATTGDGYTFRLNALDNIGVARARVVYSFQEGTGGSVNVSMVGELLHGIGNGTYSNDDLVIPSDSLVPFSYQFEVVDVNGNFAFTPSRLVSVFDDDLPVLLGDNSDDAATTGDPFDLSIDTMDNIGIGHVDVEYWFGSRGNGVQTAPMIGTNLTGLGNGTYEARIGSTPSDSLDPLFYQFNITDVEGNSYLSGPERVEVLDNDDPSFLRDNSDTHFEWFRNVTFEVNVTDNVEVASVSLHYRLDNSTFSSKTLEPYHIDPNGRGWYRVNVSIDTNLTMRIDYWINVTDGSGNWVTTVVGSLGLNDREPPVILGDMSDDIAVRGLEYTFRLSASDDYRIANAYVVYNIAGGLKINETLSMGEPLWLRIPIPREVVGSIHYHFEIVDVGGNWNRTVEKGINLVNVAPEIQTIPIWEVTEEENATLDLSGFISDVNDPMDHLTISCNDALYSVDGFLLTTFYDAWIPEHEISIEVSDGESSSTGTVVVRVINVNDEPRISTLPDKLTAAEDVVFQYRFQAGDEDEDLLHWSDDSILFDIQVTNGQISFVPTQIQVGSYKVTISVDDGKGGSDTHTFDLEITNTNDAPLVEIISPDANTTFKRNAKIRLQVEVSDEDGDDIVVTWWDGDVELGGGSPLDVRLKPGEHVITVVVDDGTDQVEKSLTVTVKKDEDSPGFGLPVVVAAAILMSLVVRRRR